MAETLTVTLDSRLTGTITKTDGFVTAKPAIKLNQKRTITNGTASGQADLLFHDRFTIAASGTQNIDLDSGTLDNVLGTIAAMVKVVGIRILNTSDKLATPTTADILVGGDFTTTIFGASTSIPIDAGGHFDWSFLGGKTVTAVTGDVITITNNDGVNQAQVDVMIYGTSA